VKSSRAYVASRLELPVITAADRASLVLVALAALFGACAAWRQGFVAVALLGGSGGLLAVVIQSWHWMRAGRPPQRWLEALPEGRLQLHVAGRPPVTARLRASTRLLGSSLFLDVETTIGTRATHIRCWLTPLDVPRDRLRRWSIVLLASERTSNRDGLPVVVG
jgi:hypothetical protein